MEKIDSTVPGVYYEQKQAAGGKYISVHMKGAAAPIICEFGPMIGLAKYIKTADSILKNADWTVTEVTQSHFEVYLKLRDCVQYQNHKYRLKNIE